MLSLRSSLIQQGRVFKIILQQIRRCFVVLSSKLQAVALFSKLQAVQARASAVSKLTLGGANAVDPYKKNYKQTIWIAIINL